MLVRYSSSTAKLGLGRWEKYFHVCELVGLTFTGIYSCCLPGRICKKNKARGKDGVHSVYEKVGVIAHNSLYFAILVWMIRLLIL